MSIKKDISTLENSLESLVIQNALYRSYNKSSRYALNTFTAYAGLESASHIVKSISTEGYFEWVKDKIADLDKRFSEMVSKLSDDHKETEDKLSETIEKVSQEASGAVLEVSLTHAQASSVKYAVKTTLDGIKFASEHISSGGQEDDGERKKLKKEITDLWDEASKEGEKTEWTVEKIKTFLETLKDDLAKIFEEFQSFVKNSKSAESDTEKDSDSDEDEAEDSKKDIVNKLNAISGWFLTVFGSTDFALIKIRKILETIESRSKSYKIDSKDGEEDKSENKEKKSSKKKDEESDKED